MRFFLTLFVDIVRQKIVHRNDTAKIKGLSCQAKGEILLFFLCLNFSKRVSVKKCFILLEFMVDKDFNFKRFED